MSIDYKLQTLRNMANKPVEETFQGILRVSNYKELEDNIPDEYLNSKYYGEDDSATWNDTIQDTIFAYYGNVNRFIKDEENDKNYRNLKLPVTDSRGYFLNLFLGESSSTIGINQEIGEIDKTSTKKYFPIIKSNILKVGVVAFNKNDIASSENVYLNIVKDDYIPKLIIYSSHYHENNKLVKKEDSEKNLTIFSDDEKMEPKKYDAFIYRQEYIDKTPTIPSTEKHAYVHIENIEEYIEKRLNSFFDINTKGVPTGMIIPHYSTLERWYCPTENYNDSYDNKEKYKGVRPALYEKALSQSKDNQFSTYNTVQGLSIGEANLKWEQNKLSEIVPEYKRDYALCDGRSYNFIVAPGITNEEKYNAAFKRFYNLFHCIGYYYTYDNEICIKGHYKNQYSAKDKKYTLGNILMNAVDVDKHLLYEITMATANVFKALHYAVNTKDIFDKHIKNKEGFYDRAKAEAWLQKCNFASIPNCIYFESYNSDILPTYSINNNITIGNIIKKFDDKISYYYYEEENNDTFVRVPGGVEIWKTAEAQKILTLFAEKNVSEQSFANIFSYFFNVPKLYTESDKEINQTLGNVKYGLFIGSNGLMSANTIEDIKTNVAYRPLDIPFIQNHTCTFNPGHYPHAHGTTASERHFSDYNNIFDNFEADTYGVATANKSISADFAINKYHNITNGAPTTSSSSEMSQNYFINQVEGASKTIVYGEQMNGIPCSDFSYNNCNWYGRTGPATNITTISGNLGSAKSTWTDEYIFRPENIRILYLIKL